VSHKFKPKQTVALAHGQREVYEIVRLMPETVSGRSTVLRMWPPRRVVRESEIRPLWRFFTVARANSARLCLHATRSALKFASGFFAAVVLMILVALAVPISGGSTVDIAP